MNTNNLTIKNILNEKLSKGKEVNESIKSKFAVLSDIEGSTQITSIDEINKSVIRTLTKHALKEYEDGNISFDIFNTKISSKYDMEGLREALDKFGIIFTKTDSNIVFQIYDEITLINNMNKKINSVNREIAIEKIIALYTSDTALKLSIGERIELNLVESKAFKNPYTKKAISLDVLILTINEINTLINILKEKHNLIVVDNKIVID